MRVIVVVSVPLLFLVTVGFVWVVLSIPFVDLIVVVVG